MPYGQFRTACLVRQHRHVGRIGGRGHRVDHRHRHVHRQRRTWIGAPSGDDQPVDPAGQQGAQVLPLADGVSPAVTQENRDLADPEGVLGTEQHGQAEPADVVGGQQADGVAAPGQQPARQRVRPETQCLGGLQHPAPGALPQ
jgi:hypothetical protein